jgi:hypothetical protein
MTGEAPGTMMTNGTVSTKVVSTPRGNEMDVSYTNKCQAGQTEHCGPGVRHIAVPADMKIFLWDKGDRSLVKAGAGVKVFAGQLPDGTIAARLVQVGPDGKTPPA